MPRFFVSRENVCQDTINITGEDVNHIKRVLRLQCGDNIIVCDGQENDYLVEITGFGSDCVQTRIISSMVNTNEPPVEITLFQGLPKSDKMDLIIQKSIELGVKRIVPVITERTVVRLADRKDGEKKAARWQRISLEAAKQNNRGIIPEIAVPIAFEQALNVAKASDLSIILYEKESANGLRSCISNREIKRLSVFVGPEGGFAEMEVERAVSSGTKPVTLGPRILRTETAGIAVLAILMYQLGDVGG